MNAALFPEARIHDVMTIYQGDLWIDRPAEGFEISPNVRLIETPGHTREDITTLVETETGITAFTQLWWSEDGPADDPYTFDRDVLCTQRERVLEAGRSHHPRPRRSVRARSFDASVALRPLDRIGSQAERAALGVTADAPLLARVDDLAPERTDPLERGVHVRDGEVGKRHPIAGPRPSLVEAERGVAAVGLPAFALTLATILEFDLQESAPEPTGSFGVIGRELDESDG